MAVLVRYTDYLENDAIRMESAVDGVRAAQELQIAILRHNREAFLYQIDPSPTGATRRSRQLMELRNWIQEARRIAETPEELRLVGEAESSIEEYIQARERLANSDPIEAYRTTRLNSELAMEKIDTLVNYNVQTADELKRSAQSQNINASRFALSLGLCLSLFLSLTLAILYRYIVRPLIRLRESLYRYGQGEADLRLTPSGLQEQKEIATTFNQMADTQAKSKQAHVRFLASVAHDLRNPLSAMAMACEAFDDPNGRLPSIIRRQTHNLDRMVNDLLEAARVEAGDFKVRPTSTDLNSLLKDTVELFNNSVTAHNLVLKCDPHLVAEVDSTRISQVVNNLISNAVKYSPMGGEIRISAKKLEDKIQIEIQDFGLGIPAEELGTIFEPFRRGTTTKETILGIGLGLSASRRIIEAHSGQIRVDSVLGKGSIFTLTLPIRQPTRAKGQNESLSENI